MRNVNLTDAKADLSALLDCVEAGDRIGILRRGKLVAELAPPQRPHKPIDVEALRAMTDKMQMQEESSGDFIRRMRDSYRY